jgi:hypothetical protein
MAVEHGAMEPDKAHLSFCREAPIVRWLWRSEMWHASDVLFNASFYRLGLECGYPAIVADRIGPAMRDARKMLGRELTHSDVAVLLGGLMTQYGWEIFWGGGKP